jgi:FixJ family two-component response regulator
LALSRLISVVDDDEGVRRSLDALVRSAGYRVATFDSAEAFLVSAAPGDSVCVISDVQMPGGMGGLELMRTILGSPSAVPVILISAFVDDRLREAALAAGAHCFLKKPFDGDKLIACVERALDV